MTSPPAVIDDLVVVGSAIDDNQRVAMPAGVVRAFDARTGALRWSWDPIPNTEPANAGADNNNDKAKDKDNDKEKLAARQTGAANAWSIMSVDPQRDLIFIPTGSASPDYYGGLRPGDNKWANSVVALHAKTGEIAWGFQLVHHDLWDYDTAAAPLLTILRHNGEEFPSSSRATKLDFSTCSIAIRESRCFPVEERRVPHERRARRTRIPHAAVSYWLRQPLAPQTVSVGRCLGPDAARSRDLPQLDSRTSQRRHFHSAQSSRHSGRARKPRRNDVERLRL